jgi:hypothetical protein
MREERPRRAGAEHRASGGLQRRVQHVLIQHVHELVIQRQRAIGKFALFAAPDEHVDPLQSLEAILDFGGVHLRGFADDRRVELVTVDAGRQQQPAVVLIHLLDLALDHPAHGFGQIARHVRLRAA